MNLFSQPETSAVRAVGPHKRKPWLGEDWNVLETMPSTSPRVVVKKAGGRQPLLFGKELLSSIPCFSSKHGEHHRGRRLMHRQWLRSQMHQTNQERRFRKIVVRTVPGICGVYSYITKLVEAPAPSPCPAPTAFTPVRRQYTGLNAESPHGVVVAHCHSIGDENSGDISDAEGSWRCSRAESRDMPSRQTLFTDLKRSLNATSPSLASVRSAGQVGFVFSQDDCPPSPESSSAVRLGSVQNKVSCVLQPLQMTPPALCDLRDEADSVLKRISVSAADPHSPTSHKAKEQTLWEEKLYPLRGKFSGERSTEEANHFGILHSKNMGTRLKYRPTYQQFCCCGEYPVNKHSFLQPRSSLLQYESHQQQVRCPFTGHKYHSQQSNSRTIHKLLSDLSIVHNARKPQGRLDMPPPHPRKGSEPFKPEMKTEAIDSTMKLRYRGLKWRYHEKLAWTLARKYRAVKQIFLWNTNHPYIHKTKYTRDQEKDKRRITWGASKGENVPESVHITEESALFQQWDPYKSPLIRKHTTAVPPPAARHLPVAGSGYSSMTPFRQRQTERETVDGGCDANRHGGRLKCMRVHLHQVSGHQPVTANNAAEADGCGVGNEAPDASENDTQDDESRQESYWDLELQLWKENIHAAISYWKPGTTYQLRSFHGFVQDIFLAVRSKILRNKGDQSKK